MYIVRVGNKDGGIDMDICMPKQHGAWAMLIIPFWLGVAASDFLWSHIAFFIGWLFLYLATYPMLLLFKKKKISYYTKWTVIYLVPAIILLLVPLLVRPSIVVFGLVMIPFFFINAYFSAKNNERALSNDLSAIFVFAIAGLASSYLPNGEITTVAMTSFFASVLFFIGCTFYVKSMIREKKNLTYKWVSWIYHTVVIIAWLIVGKWLIAMAFIPSLVRAVYLYGRKITIMQLGIVEIINATIFFIVMLFAL